jgi:hypothetical protein
MMMMMVMMMVMMMMMMMMMIAGHAIAGMSADVMPRRDAPKHLKKPMTPLNAEADQENSRDTMPVPLFTIGSQRSHDCGRGGWATGTSACTLPARGT